MNGNDTISPIVRAVLALGRRLRAERPEGSPPLSSLSILGTLNRLGPMPANRLAAEERLQPQSLTRLIATLEKDGLIERTRGQRDRRERVMSLSAGGHALLDGDLRARRRWLEAAMADTLSAEERATLRRAADIMLKLAFDDRTGSGSAQ